MKSLNIRIMKVKILSLVMVMCFAVTGYAKDIKNLFFKKKQEMQFQSCENKIKKNIRFEKGVKDIQTDLKNKTITIKYDADKTNVENLIKGFAKIKYKATVVEEKKKK